MTEFVKSSQKRGHLFFSRCPCLYDGQDKASQSSAVSKKGTRMETPIRKKDRKNHLKPWKTLTFAFLPLGALCSVASTNASFKTLLNTSLCIDGVFVFSDGKGGSESIKAVLPPSSGAKSTKTPPRASQGLRRDLIEKRKRRLFHPFALTRFFAMKRTFMPLNA